MRHFFTCLATTIILLGCGGSNFSSDSASSGKKESSSSESEGQGTQTGDADALGRGQGTVVYNNGEPVDVGSGTNTGIGTVGSSTGSAAIKDPCTLNEFVMIFSQDIGRASNQGRAGGSKTVNFPADAKDFSINIVEVHVDDANPYIWINEAQVMQVNSDRTGVGGVDAGIRQMTVDISSTLKAGANTFRGSAYDNHGSFRSLGVVITGTYRAAQCGFTQ